jgi:hypothetical protein
MPDRMPKYMPPPELAIGIGSIGSTVPTSWQKKDTEKMRGDKERRRR